VLFFRSESVVSSQDVSQSDASVPESGRLLGNDESQRGAEARAFTDSEDSARTVLENVDLQEAGADRPEVHSPSIPSDSMAVMQESLTQGDNMRQDGTEDDTVFWQSSLDSRLDRWPSEIEEGADRNWGDNAEDLHSETVDDDDREHDRLQDEADDWHDDESHGTVENWQDDYQDSALDTGPIPRTENRFIPPDDDNVYSMELRELLSRYFDLHVENSYKIILDFPSNVILKLF
jgi:hypothetical protein